MIFFPRGGVFPKHNIRQNRKWKINRVFITRRHLRLRWVISLIFFASKCCIRLTSATRCRNDVTSTSVKGKGKRCYIVYGSCCEQPYWFDITFWTQGLRRRVGILSWREFTLVFPSQKSVMTSYDLYLNAALTCLSPAHLTFVVEIYKLTTSLLHTHVE